MAKGFLKKTNALFLAAAMTVSMMPVQMVSAAEAENETLPVVERQEEERAVLDLSAITTKEYTVIEGNAPVLPKKVSLSDGSTVQIQWTEWDKNAGEGKHTVSGKAGDESISATVNVLPCDEEVADVSAMGLSGCPEQERAGAVHSLKGYKGLFVAEYDIVPDDVKSTHDRAVIYLPEAMNDGTALDAENCWDTGARLQFKYEHNGVTYFQTQNGDGQVAGNAKYYPTNDELTQALDSGSQVSTIPFDEINTYRVRTVMDTAADTTRANYKIYITDPEGVEHEITKVGGNGFRIYPKDGVVKKFAAVRGSYRIVNHKISWISGYAMKKTETYLKAQNAEDYVKEDADTITKELPGTLTGQADEELVKDGQNYALNTEMSGWYKDGAKVDSVTAQENETVTYRAYYDFNNEKTETAAAKKAMEDAVASAQQKLTEIQEADYTPESWSALQNALKDCQKLDAQTAAKEDYDAKKAALELAVEGLTKQADKAALNHAIADAQAKKEADYEAAGYQAMQEKLAAAQAVADNPNAAQAEVDAALAALQDATGKLTEKPKPTEKPSEVKVASVKAAAKTYKIAAGKKLDLKKVFTVSPENADNKNLTYSIDKKYQKFASIKAGVVTVKKKGAGKTVTVKATAADGSKASAAIRIKIMKNAVTKITVKKKSLTVKAGKKVKLKPVVQTNGKKANKKLEYISSNNKLATVKNGVVTAKKGAKGKVTITIRSTDGTNKSTKVKIKIKK